jgi:putative ABC transport system permease protein
VSYANTQADKAYFQDKEKTVTIIGTTEDYPKIYNTTFTSGEFFTASDAQGAERVAVLGAKVATELYGKTDSIGKKIKLGNQTFTVRGVVESKGGSFGDHRLMIMFISIQTMSQVYDTENCPDFAKIRSKEEIPLAISAINKQLLKTKRRRIQCV